MKRVTSWPQAVLGLAFSWGALMGWAATFGSLALGAGPALFLGLRLDDRLRHDLRAAGRARRRDRRHPLDGAAVRRQCPARRRACSTARPRRWRSTAILLAGGGVDRARRLARLRGASRLADLRRSGQADAPTALRLFRSNRDAGLLLFAGLALQGWARIERRTAASEPAQHRAGDLALEPFQRARDGLDVLDLGPMTPRNQNRRADARGDDIGVRGSPAPAACRR